MCKQNIRIKKENFKDCLFTQTVSTGLHAGKFEKITLPSNFGSFSNVWENIWNLSRAFWIILFRLRDIWFFRPMSTSKFPLEYQSIRLNSSISLSKNIGNLGLKYLLAVVDDNMYLCQFCELGAHLLTAWRLYSPEHENIFSKNLC